jgi:hypothetical protein
MRNINYLYKTSWVSANLIGLKKYKGEIQCQVVIERGPVVVAQKQDEV